MAELFTIQQRRLDWSSPLARSLILALSSWLYPKFRLVHSLIELKPRAANTRKVGLKCIILNTESGIAALWLHMATLGSQSVYLSLLLLLGKQQQLLPLLQEHYSNARVATRANRTPNSDLRSEVAMDAAYLCTKLNFCFHWCSIMSLSQGVFATCE